MRISDDDMFESIRKLELLGTESPRVNLALAVYLDLRDARAEIAQLKEAWRISFQDSEQAARAAYKLMLQMEDRLLDLRAARAEIAQLKKEKAELISCIEDIKK